MSKGLIFWIIMLLWLLAIVGAIMVPDNFRVYLVHGSTVLHFILFLLLGWAVYGAPVK